MDLIWIIIGATTSLLASLFISILAPIIKRTMSLFNRVTEVKIGGEPVSIEWGNVDKSIKTISDKVAFIADEPQVFFSYTWENKKFAKKLAADLSSLGVRTWFAEEQIHIGDTISEAINRGLEESQWVIFIPPRDGELSKWAAEELNRALKIERRSGRNMILPVINEGQEIPNSLIDRMHANFEDDYDYALKALLSSIRRKSVEEMNEKKNI